MNLRKYLIGQKTQNPDIWDVFVSIFFGLKTMDITIYRKLTGM